MAQLSLSLLGPFHATLDGEPIAGFESNKVRATSSGPRCAVRCQSRQSHNTAFLCHLNLPPAD